MFEWYLNDPAQVASTQPAERILGGSVPQAALSDGAMKATTSVPARDASVLLHAPSNVFKVSRAHDHAKALKNSLITGESVEDGLIRVDLPKLHVQYAISDGDGHHAKEVSLALITVGTRVGCFQFPVNCCTTAMLRLLSRATEESL